MNSRDGQKKAGNEKQNSHQGAPTIATDDLVVRGWPGLFICQPKPNQERFASHRVARRGFKAPQPK